MGATAIVTVMSALAFGSNADRAEAHAQVSQREIADIARSYDIPAGPISTALNSVADTSGVRIVYDSRLTRSYRTRGLSGRHNLSEALSAVLSGTGLSYELSPNGKSMLIVLAQVGDARNDASGGGATPLPTIEIGSDPSRANPGRGAGVGEGLGDRHTGYNAVSASSSLKSGIPLIKTPIAIEVVTRQTMDDQQAISVGDALLTNVSGVTQGISGYELFKVRGFYNTVGNVYKNGLMEYRIRNYDTTNLQSIEVLKGPAAMLFGRGEPGGIVNLAVKRPLETPYYSIQQQVKSFGGTRTTLDVTGPLNDDKSLLYRFNGELYSTNSYRNFVADRNVFIAPTLTFRPTEQFRVNIDFEYQSRTYVDDYPIYPAIGGAPANIPASRFLGEPSVMKWTPDHFDRKRIAYDATYEFLPDWSLTNRLSYYNITTKSDALAIGGVNQTTGAMTRVLNFFPGYMEDSFATNLDLKGKFETGPLTHSLLLGYDYFGTYLPVYAYYFYVPMNSINIYAPTYWLPENPYRITPSYGVTGQKWTGVYGQDMISFFNDSVYVLLGGRYDWTETGSNKIGTSDYAARASYVNVYANAFSPRIGLVYQPLPYLSLFGDFTQSFGANNGTTQNLAPLAPQKGEQYEAGMKAEFFDKRLTLTMAYYDIFKSNVAYADPTNSRNMLLIGKVRSQGFEFDLTGRVDDNWSVIANYTHDDVRTVQGAPSYNPLTLVSTQLAISGTKLAGSPRNYGNLWVKYDADGTLRGLALGAGVTVSESYLGDNANSFVVPGYAVVNGMISYTTQIADVTVTGQLNVKNIGNTTYFPASYDRYTIQTGIPRSFLGSVRVEF